MDAQLRQEVNEALAQRGTAELESFFQSHGLGEAFARPKEGWGRLKRINEALLEAERVGALDAVLRDAQRRFAGAAPGGQPVRGLPRLVFELEDLRDETGAMEVWKQAPQAEAWRDRLNQVLAELRVHLGNEAVQDDFLFRPNDYSGTGKTVSEPAFSRLQRAVGRALAVASSAPRSETVHQFAAPGERLESLHADIRHVSERLFRDGHTGAAIFEAYKAVNNRVKELTGLDLDGKALMGRAFDEQRPILKLNAGSNRSDRDEQEGFKFVFMGAMSGIRNPKAHEQLLSTDEDRALEYLALASLLMRRLDDAAAPP
jgi:uncharacterized protein (TIGR02391 family)